VKKRILKDSHVIFYAKHFFFLFVDTFILFPFEWIYVSSYFLLRCSVRGQAQRFYFAYISVLWTESTFANQGHGPLKFEKHFLSQISAAEEWFWITWKLVQSPNLTLVWDKNIDYVTLPEKIDTFKIFNIILICKILTLNNKIFNHN